MVGVEFSEENKKIISKFKENKLLLIKSLIKKEFLYIERETHLDFLTEKQRDELSVDDIPVSKWGYNKEMMAFLESHSEGIVLEFGAGHKNMYYDNIINLEIMNYPATDIRSYGEVLPFKDKSFDAVVSNAVFEHVQDPFQCAKEICRVLKKGGKLFLGTAFMQPYHGFPHHYYNMTKDGLKNLFDDYLSIDQITVGQNQKAIFSLAWSLGVYFNGLTDESKRNFAEVKVKDLIQDPVSQMDKFYVKNLSKEAEEKVSAGFIIKATKTS